LATRLVETGGNLPTEELSTALEELEVISEELLERSDELEGIRQEIAADREHYRRLFDRDPNAQVISTIAGLIVQANHAAQSLLEIQRGSMRTLFTPSEEAVYRRCVSAVRKSPAPYHDEATVVTPEGTRLHVLIDLRREEGEDGARLRWIFYDVTTLEQQQQQQQKRQQQQRNRLRATREEQRESAERLHADQAHTEAMLAAIGHDLRNGLGAATGLLDILIDKSEKLDEETRTKLLERAAHNTQNVQRMLEALMERARRGAWAPEGREEIDLRALAIDSLRALDLGEHPVEVSDEPAPVQAENVLAERIVANLIRNALQHTPPTTPIWIRFDRSPEGITLVVEDAGPGLSERAARRIDAPWQPATENEETTFGLGLSVVTRFAALLGGRMWVEDREGGGTRFCVLFPGTPPPAPSPSPSG